MVLLVIKLMRWQYCSAGYGGSAQAGGTAMLVQVVLVVVMVLKLVKWKCCAGDGVMASGCDF